MFDSTSRYSKIETATFALPDGRLVAYVRRRFLPSLGSLPTLAEVPIGPAERLDVFAARTLGDAEHFWRVCDANDALEPVSLEQPGRRLTIPVPTP